MSRVKRATAVEDSPARKAMAKARQRANRRRAWPRWAGRALKLGAVGLAAFAIGVGSVWALRTGRIADAGDALGVGLVTLAADAGYRVGEVFVEGRIATERRDLLAALDVTLGDPIFGIDLARLRTRLERLPWVGGALVERRLPDVVYVRLTERRPMALWQHNQQVVVIDRAGEVLTDREIGRFAWLPIVVGAEAPGNAPALLADLARVPAIAQRVEAAVWVGNRRWDLKLTNGIRVRLPEDNIAAALARLGRAAARDALLDRDIVAIDLRLPDRLVVQTSSVVLPRPKAGESRI